MERGREEKKYDEVQRLRKKKCAIPKQFELRDEFPSSHYLIFNHPPYNYPSENSEVMNRVEEFAWNYDPSE